MDALLALLRTYTANSQTAEMVFILLIGSAAFVFALGALAFVLAFSDPLRRRLDELSAQEPNSPSSGRFDWLRPLSRYATPSHERERSRVARLLSYAGFRSPQAQSLFYATKALLMVGFPIAVCFASPFFPSVSSAMLLSSASGGAFLGSLLPSIWLDHRVKSRQRELRASFPDALDLMVVCVESGLGLTPALQRVADELGVSHPELGAELSLVNAEMRAGVERTQALRNLAERTGLDDIRGLMALLVQTMRFGTSIADALRVYSEEFRDKRMQAAEEQAAKIGTKMIFPLILCLFPSFFLVAIGPAVLRLISVFGQIPH
jgi:tight adherence protein C